jgi:hypothetical protein
MAVVMVLVDVLVHVVVGVVDVWMCVCTWWQMCERACACGGGSGRCVDARMRKRRCSGRARPW